MKQACDGIAFFGISDRGMQRAKNEDHFMVADLTRHVIGVDQNRVRPDLLYQEVGERGILLAVADGLGGYEGGELASRIAVQATVQALFDMTAEGIPCEEQLAKAVDEAHRAIHRYQRDSERSGRMASTLTAMHIGARMLTVVQVGDSRAYLYRDGELCLLTEDQTVVRAMHQRGILSAEEARNHPDRHIVLQALGQHNVLKPEVYTLPYQHNDRVLLCTDGLSSYVSHTQIEALSASAEDERQCCHCLIDAANASGGKDNATVLLAHLMVAQGDRLS